MLEGSSLGISLLYTAPKMNPRLSGVSLGTGSLITLVCNAAFPRRIEGAIANLKKQHIWGAVDDDSFKAEFQSLDRQRRTLRGEATPVQLPNLERAAQLLQDLPTLWQHPGVKDEHRRSLAREVFEELRLREGKLVATKPRPEYAPLFAYSLWRHGIVGGTRSS